MSSVVPSALNFPNGSLTSFNSCNEEYKRRPALPNPISSLRKPQHPSPSPNSTLKENIEETQLSPETTCSRRGWNWPWSCRRNPHSCALLWCCLRNSAICGAVCTVRMSHLNASMSRHQDSAWNRSAIFSVAGCDSCVERVESHCWAIVRGPSWGVWGCFCGVGLCVGFHLLMLLPFWRGSCIMLDVRVVVNGGGRCDGIAFRGTRELSCVVQWFLCQFYTLFPPPFSPVFTGTSWQLKRTPRCISVNVE